jgi:hypothetical protein
MLQAPWKIQALKITPQKAERKPNRCRLLARLELETDGISA